SLTNNANCLVDGLTSNSATSGLPSPSKSPLTTTKRVGLFFRQSPELSDRVGLRHPSGRSCVRATVESSTARKIRTAAWRGKRTAGSSTPFDHPKTDGRTPVGMTEVRVAFILPPPFPSARLLWRL